MTSPTKLIIIGAGHAYWEVYDLILDINKAGTDNLEIAGILDDDKEQWGREFNGIAVSGPLESAKDYPNDVRFVLAIGSHRTLGVRHALLKKLGLDRKRFQTLIHPSAKVFSTARIGEGCIIHYGSVIFSFTVLRPFAIISANCVIAVQNLIGRGAMLGSNITTTTGVRIGSYAFIGSSTTIAEQVEVGPCAKVGMTSNIFRNIKPGMTVLGNPPKMISRMAVDEEIIETWEREKKQVLS